MVGCVPSITAQDDCLLYEAKARIRAKAHAFKGMLANIAAKPAAAAAFRLQEATESGHAGETVEPWHTFERLAVDACGTDAPRCSAMIKLAEGWQS
jgi:HPt (histidine-containing phosphotransfer) domain-containing protein